MQSRTRLGRAAANWPAHESQETSRNQNRTGPGWRIPRAGDTPQRVDPHYAQKREEGHDEHSLEVGCKHGFSPAAPLRLGILACGGASGGVDAGLGMEGGPGEPKSLDDLDPFRNFEVEVFRF